MTDHAKNIEYWADAGIVENTNETAMTIQGARDLRRLELYAAAAELRRLQAENARLAAILRAMTVWLEANEPGVFSRGIWDAIRQAEEASLAQLPEKRE